MLTPHPSAEPGEPGGGPVLRPATPMTSIQQYESPDAAEAYSMADQRPTPPARDQRAAEETGTPPVRGNARVRPAAPSGADASGPVVADIQTTSGVPKVVIPAAVPAPAPVRTAADGPEPDPTGPADTADPSNAADASDLPTPAVAADLPTPADAADPPNSADADEAVAAVAADAADAADAEPDTVVVDAPAETATADVAAGEPEAEREPAVAAEDADTAKLEVTPKIAVSTDKTDTEQIKGDKAPDNPQAEVEVEAAAERDPEAEVKAEAAAPDPDATMVMVLPGLDDTVVLRVPDVDETVVLALPRHPTEETVVLRPRALDDTVVIPVVPATTVAPPTAVVTAVIPVVPGNRDARRTEVAPPPDPGRTPRPARARREPLDLGHAPSVLTISALGVLMVALAYAGGRVSTGNAQFAYWVGQVVVFTPVVVRLLSRRMAGVAESFLLVMGLALHQYLLKWMYSPDQFRFPDELQHWLATTIIVESGELFRPNPALPPAEHFPGLAELGAAVAVLTGLPVTAAGVIVAGIAHLVFVGMLFAVVLRASNSPAVAGVACATYATALHYLFFNSMFLYQTAALPFFMLAIWAVRRWRAEGGRMFAALAVVSMALTTVSHHVTAFALVATLLLLALAEIVLDRPRRWSALAMPGAATVVVAAWILLVASDVLGYLEAPVDQVRRTVSQLFSGESDPASVSAPVSLGQLAVQGAGLLGLLVLYLAVTRDMLHRRDRDWWRWAAVAGGLVFFAGNGVRFLGQNGPEIAGRLSTFTYIPISILAAIGLVRGVQLIPARDADGHRWRAAAPAIDVLVPGGWNLYSRVAAGAAMITLLMIGARAGGWPPIATILPGPYLAGGYERSVDAYGVASADWQRTALGPGNRVGGDATSVSLASTYGRQDPVREVGPLYYADAWGLEQDDLVQRVHVQYLVVDRRLSTQVPESGAYFESDPRSGQITSPLTTGQLGKFDSLTGIDRLYDNGTVRIYRTGVQ